MIYKIILIAIIVIISFILGYFASKLRKPNGKIILGHNENGDERICFALNLEYDDFKNYKQIIFDVITEN